MFGNIQYITGLISSIDQGGCSSSSRRHMFCWFSTVEEVQVTMHTGLDRTIIACLTVNIPGCYFSVLDGARWGGRRWSLSSCRRWGVGGRCYMRMGSLEVRAWAVRRRNTIQPWRLLRLRNTIQTWRLPRCKDGCDDTSHIVCCT